MKPTRSLVQDPGSLPRPAIAGDGPNLNVVDTILATVGAGTLLASLLQSGLLVRNGPTAAYIDTLDTAANLDLAMPNMAAGDSLDVIYSNNVAFAATIAVAAGIVAVSAAGNLVVPASSSKIIHLKKLAAGSYNLYVL